MDMNLFLGPDNDILKKGDNNFTDITDCFVDDNAIVKHWCNIGNEKYYFKCLNDVYTLINELIGERLSNVLSLPTIHYELAKTSIRNIKVYGAISKNFIRPNVIYLKDSQITMKNINKANNRYQILQELYEVLFLDFYMSQIDRVSCNLVLKKEGKDLHLNDLFDYGASFNTLCKTELYPYFRNACDYYAHYYSENSDTMDEKYICTNFLFGLTFPSHEFYCVLRSFPDLLDVLEKLYKFELIDEIHAIEERIGVKISDQLINYYKVQQNSKRKIMERI